MSRIDYRNSLLVGVPAVQQLALLAMLQSMITLLPHLLSYIGSQYGLG